MFNIKYHDKLGNPYNLPQYKTVGKCLTNLIIDLKGFRKENISRYEILDNNTGKVLYYNTKILGRLRSGAILAVGESARHGLNAR